MEKQSELYFTIGEFVRILGVGKHTLLHYDEIGLFSPAIKEEDGYRYYFVWQMDTFEVVHILQELRISPGETKEYIENRSPERFMSTIDRKKHQISEEIRRLKNMKCFILRKEESVKPAMDTTLDEPRLVERDREYLLVSGINAGLEQEAAVEIAEHVRMQERYNDVVGAVGSIYLGKDLGRGMYDRCMKVYTRLDEKAVSHRIQNRPEGIYVELYSRGHLWNIEKSYRFITAFAGGRRIRLGEIWYEGLMPDELTVKAYKQYIAKITVPVGSP